MGKNKYGKEYKSKKKASGSPKNKGGAPIKGGKIKASHILVDKLKEAEEIYDQVQSGADFAKVAKKYSTCSSKNKGGDLGSFPKGTMVPEFWDACVSLKINEISRPVKSRFGYHIIKRTG